jgi:hypothetical protein
VSLDKPIKPLGSCASRCNIASSGVRVFNTISIAFVIQPLPCTRGNEARGVLAGSSIVKTAGSIRGEPKVEHHLCMEKARDSLWSYASMVLSPRVGYPFVRKMDLGPFD